MLKRSKLLFLDPSIVRESRGVKLCVCPPEKVQIVIKNDKPWESRFISFYSSVIYDEGKYRLYYSLKDKNGRGGMAYAESLDGYDFVKPPLRIATYGESLENNLLGISSLECTVFKDSSATADKRYKCYSHAGGVGIVCHTSPDGIHWNISEKPLLPYFCDSQNVAFFDEELGRYVCYLRGWERINGKRSRTVKRCTQESLEAPHVITGRAVAIRRQPDEQPIVNEEFPTVFACDEADGEGVDVYTMAAEPCPDAEGYYVAFPTLYTHAPSIAKGGEYDNNGDIETYFAGSADGITWHRYDRGVFIKNDLLEDFPTRMTFAGTGIIHEGNKFIKYGTLLRTRHAENDKRDLNPDGAIVRLENREFGYVAAVFDGEGELTLMPCEAMEEYLSVNLQTTGDGFLRVGLRDCQGNDIPGFSADECLALSGDGTSLPVSWLGGRRFNLKGQTVTVYLKGSQCKLYSIDFIKGEA